MCQPFSLPPAGVDLQNAPERSGIICPLLWHTARSKCRNGTRRQATPDGHCLFCSPILLRASKFYLVQCGMPISGNSYRRNGQAVGTGCLLSNAAACARLDGDFRSLISFHASNLIWRLHMVYFHLGTLDRRETASYVALGMLPYAGVAAWGSIVLVVDLADRPCENTWSWF